MPNWVSAGNLAGVAGATGAGGAGPRVFEQVTAPVPNQVAPLDPVGSVLIKGDVWINPEGPEPGVGPTGAAGSGATGATGAAGTAGATGASGAAGATGPAGDPATNLVTSVAGRQGVVTLTKSDVGLSNVPNTDATARANHTGTQLAATISDFDAAVTAVALAGAVTSVATRTGDVTLTKSDVGLSNVANSLQLVAANNLSDLTSASQAKTNLNLVKADVGLNDADNTSDVDKPVSTAQATADTASRARSNHTGTQAASTITNFSSAADARIALQSGAIGGFAPLDSGSKISSTYLPALAITTPYTVTSQAEQLALVVQEGDVAIRSDVNQSYISNGGSAGTMADWYLLATPTDAVASVAGRTGVVTLSASDVGLGSVTNTSDAGKPVSTAQQTALDLKANSASPTLTGTPAAPTATAGTSTTQLATTAFVAAAVLTIDGGTY